MSSAERTVAQPATAAEAGLNPAVAPRKPIGVSPFGPNAALMGELAARQQKAAAKK